LKRLSIFLLLCLGFGFATAAPFGKNEAIGVSVVSLLIWNPMKLDGVGLDYATDDQLERTRMLWLWRFKESINRFGPVELNGHVEFAFGQTMPKDPVVSFGLTPVLEWQFPVGTWTPLIETGLGASYFTKTSHLDTQTSTHFQFSEILGVALKTKRVQVGLRYQHHSNGDIVKPNNGYNFYGVTLKYWY
jgi:hypothetical protein